jgi:hypothetical protein
VAISCNETDAVIMEYIRTQETAKDDYDFQAEDA